MTKFLVASLMLASITVQAQAVPVPPNAQKVPVYNCPQPVGHDTGCIVHQKAVRK